MRISSNFLNTLYNTPIRQNQDPAGAAASSGSNTNYDAITISSVSPEEMDLNFASTIKNLILKEMNQPASPEKLDTLKQKIADGTYQVDANKIAERILLYKGAGNNE